MKDIPVGGPVGNRRLETLNFKTKVYALVVAVMLAAVLVAGCSSSNTNASATKSQNVAKSAPKAPSSIPKDEPVAQVAAQLSPSVVQVDVKGVQQTSAGPQQEQGLGSGVIYRKDGYIITNNHVVQGASSVNILFADGKTTKGQVVGADPYTDIAMVKVDRNNLPAAKFSTGRLLVGQLAVAIGSPSGFQSTVTAGVISGVNRELGAQLGGAGPQTPSLTNLIQTDAPISPGNSGGALGDRSGQVVGINVAYLPQTQSGQPVEGIGFAIPSATATSVADQIIADGKAVHPFLGIRGFADVTPQFAQQFGIKAKSGVIVQVAQGEPLAQAGGKTRDVITAIGSHKIKDSGDLISALRDYKPGDTVEVKVMRGGNEKTLNVKLGTLPQQG